MEIQAVILHEQDNVAVLPQPAQAGDSIGTSGGTVSIRERISAGHKAAIRPIALGESILKYGVVIGQAERDIAPGEWVHTHNVKDITEQLCNAYAANYRAKAKEEREHGYVSGV